MKQVLEIEGNRYEITHFEIELAQPISEDGFPTSRVKGGKITLGIPFDMQNHDRNPNSYFFSWMITKDDRKYGIIEFYDNGDFNDHLRINFQNAYCVNYKKIVDYLRPNRGVPHINKEIISISAMIIEMDGEKFVKTELWPLNVLGFR